MKIIFSVAILLMMQVAGAQELFVFSSPASNMPAKSMSARLDFRTPVNYSNNQFRQRYMPSVMVGASKTVMLHIGASFSDFYSSNVQWESVKGYAQWRFYADDDVHRHFRMAAYAEGAYSKNPFVYGDINLDGDNSGVQTGLIATKLVNKFAISGTAGVIKVFANPTLHLNNSLWAVNYSLATGYLLFPMSYTNYNQPNLNLYVEAIGMRGLDHKDYMLDIAPALQLILNSNFKINIGARFQATGNMLRAGENNYYVGLERTFLGALSSHKKQL